MRTTRAAESEMESRSEAFAMEWELEPQTTTSSTMNVEYFIKPADFAPNLFLKLSFSQLFFTLWSFV